MTLAIEQRLATARKARQGRLDDREIPTVADVILSALDALPGLPEQLEQVKAWATNRKTDNLCAQLQQGVAAWWVAGPKK